MKKNDLDDSDKHVTGIIRSLSAPIGVLYISSYIPRKCGIATFTKYLTNGINLINPLKRARIFALNNDISESLDYPEEVIFQINENNISDFKRAANLINKSKSIELVSLQHEFGIYGENDGVRVVDFIKMVKKPKVTTVHSLRADYVGVRRNILQELYEYSDFSVVMLDAVRARFAQIIEKNPEKLVVIPHGVLDFPMLEAEFFKKKLGLQKKVVMTSINLLSEWKGIEYAIKAVPKIIEKIPNFIYLVIGETHPTYILRHKGDIYRKMLNSLVKKLNIEKNVKFINRYVTTNEQKDYIGASDFYITPYLDSQQASSGSLAFAIGAGKVCISTPYLYAKEMLKRGRGVLVPFRSVSSIANAVISVLNNTEKLKWYQKKAYEKGRLMTWANVGHQYYHLFGLVRNSN